MTVTEKVQEILEAASGVTALVPTTRIRVPGDWQNLAQPYIIHRPISDEPQYTYGGLRSVRIWPYYQVSAFASTFSAAEAIVIALRAALAGLHGSTFIWISAGTYLGTVPVSGGGIVHHFALDLRIRESL